MSLDTSSTLVGATPTANISPLTTPFVPPISCHTVRELSSTTKVGYFRAVIPLLFSNPANTRYVECQPTQYEPGPRQQSFSPAVCPLSWIYYHVATHLAPPGVESTATCCMSGYTLDELYGIETSLLCTSFFGGTPGITTTLLYIPLPNEESPTTTTTLTRGILAHPAWFIAWKESDVSTLSPQPPALTSAMSLGTWRPGQTPVPGANDNFGNGPKREPPPTPPKNKDSGFVLQLVIIIPIAICALIVFCGSCCCWRSRESRIAAAAAAAAENGTADGTIALEDQSNQLPPRDPEVPGNQSNRPSLSLNLDQDVLPRYSPPEDALPKYTPGLREPSIYAMQNLGNGSQR